MVRLTFVKRGRCRMRNAGLVPWTLYRYPPSMANLPGRVRAKAIGIANALLEEGMEEGKAIRIAMAKAKQWAERGARAAGRSG